MKKRIIGALALVAIVAATVAATTASGGATANTLTVWLMTDAQQNPNWEKIVNAASAAFEKDHPGWNVNVQYKTWGNHLQQFDATLAGGNAPDVIELGNTEMTKYMAAGAFQDLTSLKSSIPNSGTWLEGLEASGRYGGKLYGVPYYAGARVVTYRTDLFKAAGIKKVPTSLAELTAAAKKLDAKNKTKGFSPVYLAGTDWYTALGFVYDFGGKIATQVSGKWKGTLDSPRAIAGLTAYKNFFNAASHASKTTDEAHPYPYDAYAKGLAGAITGASWVTCCIGKYKGVSAQFVLPSHTKGQLMPSFQGGSNLGVPIGANKQAAVDWIKEYTSNASMTAMRALGTIPNTKSLLGNTVGEKSASRAWVVPTAKNWVNVENGNILRNMLAQILTNKLTVKQAAASASDNITSVLNG
jgi:N,N'-diacetylchitobiose transport system substrate-binding protein